MTAWPGHLRHDLLSRNEFGVATELKMRKGRSTGPPGPTCGHSVTPPRLREYEHSRQRMAIILS